MSNESKDLQVACYFCAGLMYELEVRGLIFGLEYINYLMMNCWETFYPPINRINGRWLAIEWLIDQIQIYLDAISIKKLDEAVALKEQFTLLDKEIFKFNNESKHVLLLIKRVDRFISSINDNKDKVESGNLNRQKEQSIDSSLEKPITSVEEAYKKLDAGVNIINEVSFYLSSIESTKEEDILESFRLLIQSVWSTIKSLPEFDNNGNTKINYPHKANINQLKTLTESKNYSGIINIGQDWIRENPYWFDLYKNIYDSMSRLDNYISSATLLKQETRAIVFRFPEILDLKFSDGTKMVGNNTLSWLLEDLGGVFGNISNSEKEVDDFEVGSQFERELADINKMNGDQKLSRLLKLNSDSNSLYKVQKILLKINILEELLKQEKNLSILRGYVSSLLEDFHYFHINEWDPRFASKLLSTVILAKNKIQDDASDLCKILCEIDLDAAIKLFS